MAKQKTHVRFYKFFEPKTKMKAREKAWRKCTKKKKMLFFYIGCHKEFSDRQQKIEYGFKQLVAALFSWSVFKFLNCFFRPV